MNAEDVKDYGTAGNGTAHANEGAHGDSAGQGDSGGTGNSEPEVCKDFLRGMCTRGSGCRYNHPGGAEAGGAGSDERKRLSFCHDFQNKGCFRPKCRFIHCPRSESDDYKRSGKVTEFMAIAILAAGQGSEEDVAGTPICKDFKLGRCDRGRNRCRYWHIDPIAAQGGSAVGAAGPPVSAWGPGGGPREGPMPPAMVGGGPFGGYGGSAGPPMKRLREDVMGPSSVQEEVLVLRQKLDLYKKQVVDLTAANEVLLEQNARLRAKLQVACAQGAGGQEPQRASGAYQQRM